MKLFKSIALSLALALPAAGALAAGGAGHVEDYDFSFEGPFGKFDQNQLQRGLKVYTEVCAACHGLRQVYFRNLSDEGGPHLPEDQMKAYAKEWEVADDGPDAEPGDTRAAKPQDKFPPNTSLGAPDLSLMAKARAGFHGPYGSGISQFFNGMGGPEYIASLLSGYTGEEKEEAGVILYENTAFPGGWISMGPPLEDGLVDFDDEHANDLHHMSEDVAAFLMWTAEPKMMARQRFGLVAVAFLGFFTILLYFTNKQLWKSVKRKD